MRGVNHKIVESTILTTVEIIFECLRTNTPISLNYCILHFKRFIHSTKRIFGHTLLLKHVVQVEGARHIKDTDKAHFDKHCAKIVNHRFPVNS